MVVVFDYNEELNKLDLEHHAGTIFYDSETNKWLFQDDLEPHPSDFLEGILTAEDIWDGLIRIQFYAGQILYESGNYLDTVRGVSAK